MCLHVVSLIRKFYFTGKKCHQNFNLAHAQNGEGVGRKRRQLPEITCIVIVKLASLLVKLSELMRQIVYADLRPTVAHLCLAAPGRSPSRPRGGSPRPAGRGSSR